MNLAYGNPSLVLSTRGASAFVVGYGEGGFYGNQLISADSLIGLMKGEIVPRGRLPVRVSDRFPIGTGITC